MKFNLKLNNMNNRNFNIVKNIGLGAIYKGISILIGFLLVPLSIKYLGVEQYGLWLTIFSFVSWFNFFDFGIGHGLRNKLSEALALENYKLAREYVSTAYFTILCVSLIMVLISTLTVNYVNWSKVFNSSLEIEVLTKVVIIVLMTFGINLFCKLITAVYFANQNSSFPHAAQLINQVFSYIGVFFAFKLDFISLVIYCAIVSIVPVLIYFFITYVTFKTIYYSLRPSIKFCQARLIKPIMNLGVSFFFIQLSSVILYSTDNFIINMYFNSAEVTIYNVVFKYLSIITMSLTIFLSPYWSAITNAHTNDDYSWLNKTISFLYKIVIIFCLMTVFLVYFSNVFFDFWLDELVKIPNTLVITMGVNTMIMCILQLCSTILNGVGKLKSQLIIGGFAAIINIPLSIFLAVEVNLGVNGIVIATLITNLIALCFYPLQVNKIIQKKAKGFWNA